MDTGGTYVKMCEALVEIQSSWEPAHADWYWGIGDLHDDWEDKRFYGVHLLVDFDSEGGHFHLEPEHINKEYAVWLPYQDQLQVMVGGYTLELLDKFHSFCMWDEQFEELRDKMLETSMEQLWLAFVMNSLYQKQWSGEEWNV